MTSTGLNPPSFSFFSYLSKVLQDGNKRALGLSDIMKLPETHTSKFEKYVNCFMAKKVVE